jgi:1-acyl-sn-glycerol-3-phosphate acyltransferase
MRELLTRLCYAASKLILWLGLRLWCGLEVHGQQHVPRRGAFIIAGNHVSYLDPPVVGVACPRPARFMARDTLFRHPLLGAYLRAIGVIPLARGEHDPRALRQALRRLRAGEAVAIFPEGHRQLSGELGAARRGVGLLAMTAKVAIVPVLLQGTRAALPPGSGWLRRAKIRVAFAPAIPYTGASFDAPADAHRASGGPSAVRSARDAHQALADEVTRQWHRLQERWGR